LTFNITEVKHLIDSFIPSENYLYGIKISGEFSTVKTRSVPKQSKPYPLLSEVIKKQTTFETKNITGTVVGFKMPEYIDGVNVKDFHFHFLSKDETFGGHLLDLTLKKGTIELETIKDFRCLLPSTENFSKTKLIKEETYLQNK